MLNKPRILALLVAAACQVSCGGGGDGSDHPEVGVPTPQPAPLALAPSNYEVSAKSAVRTSSIAFDAARLAGETAAVMLDQPVNFFPNWPCPEGGSVSFELTDRNRNGNFNADDRLHIGLDRCVTNGFSLNGLMRVELQKVTVQPDGRDYDLTFEMVDLTIDGNVANEPSRRFNFSGTLSLSRGANHEHWVLSFGNLDLREGDSTITALNLLIDYSQRYELGSYEYIVQGDLVDSRLGGVLRVTSPVSLTGTIGQYPTAGRLLLTGAANSAARVSEEGAAASDDARVLIAVDVNGDGSVDEQLPGALWSDLTYNVFGSLRDSADALLLPLR